MIAAIRGRGCGLDDALEAAVGVLSTARFPLVYGLVDSTVEAQREAVRVARLLCGAVDPASSSGHAGALACFQRDGALIASLGEMQRRTDLVVFWGCDPEREHPGFVSRFAGARPGRIRVSVDVAEARGPEDADERTLIPASSEIAALAAVRALLRGRRLDPDVAGGLGLAIEPLRGLVARLRTCAYGAVVADAEPPPSRHDPARPDLLAGIVRDARPRAHLRLVALRPRGNAVGAESVLTWLTGFPACVSFATGSAAFGPGEFSGEALLSRGETDAVLVVGADPSRHLSEPARRGLAKTPTVWLAPPGSANAADAAVLIATAPLERSAGHVFRMDGLVPAPRPRESSDPPQEAAILARLATQLERTRAAS